MREREGPSAASLASRGSPSTDLLELFGRHRLTPAQRRIAQCLVERAAEAPFLSSGEVAALAGVSQPSVTRFAVAMGFTGFPALRREMRALMVTGVSESADQVRRNELQQAVRDEIANIALLDDVLTSRDAIGRAGALLARSVPLPVLGLRASGGLAHYFGFFAAKVHPDVRVLDAGGSQLFDRLEQAAASGATSMLAFVLPRYPQESIELLVRAKALGIRAVTVSDSELGPAREVSEVLLAARVGSRLVFDSQAAPMLLAMLVLQEMCDVDPETTQARLDAFERSAADRRVFVR